MYQDARKKPLSTRLCGWMSGVTNRKYMTTWRAAVCVTPLVTRLNEWKNSREAAFSS
jgi:hypothetical protein